MNLDLAQILRTQLTADQRELLANALEDHYDKLRHNDSGIIGQLYDGDAEIVRTAADLLATLERVR